MQVYRITSNTIIRANLVKKISFISFEYELIIKLIEDEVFGLILAGIIL